VLDKDQAVPRMLLMRVLQPWQVCVADHRPLAEALRKRHPQRR